MSPGFIPQRTAITTVSSLDYSDLSQKALDEAIALAKLTNAEVMLLHVLSALDKDYPPHFSYPITELGYANSALYEDMIQHYAQQWQNFEQENLKILQSFVRDAEAQGVTVKSLANPVLRFVRWRAVGQRI
jgi:nucleotide-binding universal stress UspA family protein